MSASTRPCSPSRWARLKRRDKLRAELDHVKAAQGAKTDDALRKVQKRCDRCTAALFELLQASHAELDGRVLLESSVQQTSLRRLSEEVNLSPRAHCSHRRKAARLKQDAERNSEKLERQVNALKREVHGLKTLETTLLSVARVVCRAASLAGRSTAQQIGDYEVKINEQAKLMRRCKAKKPLWSGQERGRIQEIQEKHPAKAAEAMEKLKNEMDDAVALLEAKVEARDRNIALIKRGMKTADAVNMKTELVSSAQQL